MLPHSSSLFTNLDHHARPSAKIFKEDRRPLFESRSARKTILQFPEDDIESRSGVNIEMVGIKVDELDSEEQLQNMDEFIAKDNV